MDKEDELKVVSANLEQVKIIISNLHSVMRDTKDTDAIEYFQAALNNLEFCSMELDKIINAPH